MKNRSYPFGPCSHLSLFLMLSTSSKLNSVISLSSSIFEHAMVKASVLSDSSSMALNPYAAPYFALSCYSSSASPAYTNQTSIYYAYPPPTSWPCNGNYIPLYDNIYRYHFLPTKHFSVPANSSAAETCPPPASSSAEAAAAAVGPTEPEEVEKKNKEKSKGFYDAYYGELSGVSATRRRGNCRHGRSARRDDEDFRLKEECSWKTTVMIKNIPNKMNKNELLEVLDAHCRKENQKILSGECDGDDRRSLSEFDFLYLPMDFSSGSNLGYAFLNFTSARAAWRLYNGLHNTSWNKYGSRKVCEITYARLQGLSMLEAHFKNSVFSCESDDYLPVIFVPCRNGLGPSEYRYVARRFPCAKK